MHKRDLPSLDLLKGFEAAARNLSFTKAAAELFVTQSAISRQVKALEDQLGISLFRRRHRERRLTEQGQTLYKTSGEVLPLLPDVAGTPVAPPAGLQPPRRGLLFPLGRAAAGRVGGSGRWVGGEVVRRTLGKEGEADPAIRKALYAFALGFPRLFHCPAARIARPSGGRRILALAAAASPNAGSRHRARGPCARSARRARADMRT